MLTPQTIAVFCIFVLCACSHPIEIVGDGDVLSATGTRNCYLEDYAAGRDSCARNLVVEGYFETYYAMPRRGWKFTSWGNYCEGSGSAECSFKLGAVTVMQHWGASVPPLIAVFSPISQTGLEQPVADSDPVDQREAAEKEAARIVTEQATRIAAEKAAANKAAEPAAAIAAEQKSAIKVAEQPSATVAEQSTAIPNGVAKVVGSAKLRWSIPVTRQDGAPLRPAELAHYEIYFTAQSTGQKKMVVVNNPMQANHTVSNLPPDVYRFAMVAVDKSGLYSKLSATVTLKIGGDF